MKQGELKKVNKIFFCASVVREFFSAGGLCIRLILHVIRLSYSVVFTVATLVWPGERGEKFIETLNVDINVFVNKLSMPWIRRGLYHIIFMRAAFLCSGWWEGKSVTRISLARYLVIQDGGNIKEGIFEDFFKNKTLDTEMTTEYYWSMRFH